jgi:hypothetical protein
MLFALFGLIPGIQVVYRFGCELTERDFMELTPEQYDAYRRKVGPTQQRIYRIVLIEPSAIERTSEKVTYELEIASEQEKSCILAAVDHIRNCSKELNPTSPTFAERLEFLRQRWPPEVTGMRK